MKTYNIIFNTGQTNCSSTIDIESVDDFLNKLEGKVWLTLVGEPTISIQLSRVDNIKFIEVKNEDTK